MGSLSMPFLVLLISSLAQLRFTAGGRAIPKPFEHSLGGKAISRAQIGSRPPRCEIRCSACDHCEAIQVPANSQIESGFRSNSSSRAEAESSRGGEDSSNYKPMSWKCKCGNYIFNP